MVGAQAQSLGCFGCFMCLLFKNNLVPTSEFGLGWGSLITWWEVMGCYLLLTAQASLSTRDTGQSGHGTEPATQLLGGQGGFVLSGSCALQQGLRSLVLLQGFFKSARAQCSVEGAGVKRSVSNENERAFLLASLGRSPWLFSSLVAYLEESATLC